MNCMELGLSMGLMNQSSGGAPGGNPRQQQGSGGGSHLACGEDDDDEDDTVIDYVSGGEQGDSNTTSSGGGVDENYNYFQYWREPIGELSDEEILDNNVSTQIQKSKMKSKVFPTIFRNLFMVTFWHLIQALGKLLFGYQVWSTYCG